MNTYSGLSLEALAVELEYRRSRLAVTSPRRHRRARRAVR